MEEMTKNPSVIAGRMAISILEGCSYSGRVHSIFAKAVNFLVQEDYLITVLPWQYTAGPLYLLVKQETFAQLHQDARCRDSYIDLRRYITPGQVIIKECKFPPPPKKINENTLLKNLFWCKGILKKEQALSQTAKSILTAECGLGYQALVELREKGLSKILESGDAGGILKLLYPLVGLGSGLTPSGDDVIYGIMASVHYLKEHMKEDVANRLDAALKELVKRSLQSTTLISYNMLRAGSQGAFTDYVINAVKAIATGTNEEVKDSLSRLICVGSSSGCDMAVGIMTGLEQLLKEV